MRQGRRRMPGASTCSLSRSRLKGKPMIVSLLTVAVLVLAVAGSAALYLLPVLIGAARRVPGLGAVAVINVLLGWTLAGWAVALAMSLPAPCTPPRQPCRL